MRMLGLLVLLALNACTPTAAPEIRSLADVAHARIGVMTGSTGEGIAAARFPEGDIKSFDDIMDAVAALKSGQLDCVITGYPSALQVTKKNAELGLLPDALADEDTAIAVRKDSPELLAQLDAIIREFQTDGTLAAIDRRWFKPDLSPYEEPVIDVPTAGEPLRVGVSATREPFSFVDKTGRVTGHDGELARRIAVKLGRPLEFSNMKFMALIPALQSGRVDLIVTGMTASEERRKSVSFSIPYYANHQVLVTRKLAGRAAAKGPVLSSPADLADKRIGVLLGSAHEVWARKNLPKATILNFQAASDVILAVKTDKVDAALFDADPLKLVLQDNPDLGAMPGALFSFPVAPGFSKDRPELTAAWDALIAKLQQSGELAEIRRRWIDDAGTAMPALPSSLEGAPPLVLGTTDVGLPFAAVREGEMVGLDIELAQRFAASLGRPLEIRNLEFSALIAAVAAGKVDVISSSIFVTEERKQRIDFGAPYHEMGTQAFARRELLEAGAVESGPAEKPFFTRVADSFRANILHEDRYLLLWEGLKTTVLISVLATLAGTLIGALVCFLRMSPRPLLNLLARTYINLIRGMPVLVLLMLIFYVVFASVNINPVLVAVIAFGMNFGAYVAEIFRSGIESIDRGQHEAGIAMGFSPIQTFRYIILPQTVRRILPVYRGEFISLVKMTSIVGYIAVQDLTKASDIIRSRTFDAFFPLVMVAVLYFVISWVLMLALEYLERATDPRRRREARGGRA
jgi:polar amino acid transport system substrate-binding protein